MSTLERARASRGAAVKIVAAWILLPLFFLVTGGSFRWWQAWFYCLVILVPATLFIARVAVRDPDFIERRSKMREKERAQRRVVAWGSLPTLAAFVIPGLDHRFGWSEPPVAAEIVAMAVALGSYLAVLRVFIENRWAGRTIETYGDQQVVSTGPYAIVRHPMYASATLLYLATPVALGSWWAVIPALAYIPIFVFRIRNEEEVLVRDLPDYGAYQRRVRYKLVPFVW